MEKQEEKRVQAMQKLVKRFISTQRAVHVLEDGVVEKHSPFVPTSAKLIEEFIAFAKLSEDDVLVDLGSGDGSVLISCASLCSQSIGIEIDGKLVERAKAAVPSELKGKVLFEKMSLFSTSHEDQQKIHLILQKATVVWVYLMPRVLEDIQNILKTSLRPGSRVISSTFSLPSRKPDDFLIPVSSPFFKLHLYKF